MLLKVILQRYYIFHSPQIILSSKNGLSSLISKIGLDFWMNHISMRFLSKRNWNYFDNNTEELNAVEMRFFFYGIHCESTNIRLDQHIPSLMFTVGQRRSRQNKRQHRQRSHVNFSAFVQSGHYNWCFVMVNPFHYFPFVCSCGFITNGNVEASS